MNDRGTRERWRPWQLAYDAATYGPDAGRWILVSEDGAREHPDGEKFDTDSDAERRAGELMAVVLVEELADYVLPGEPCPERCVCDSEDGEHDPGNDDLLDALTLFVRRARELDGSHPRPSPDRTPTAPEPPERVYLVISSCEDHGGHGDAYRTLESARGAIATRRAEWLEISEGEDPPTLFEVDTPDELVMGELAIRIDTDADGAPAAIPVRD